MEPRAGDARCGAAPQYGPAPAQAGGVAVLDGAVGKGLEEARGRAPVVLGGNAPAGAVTVATMFGRLDPRGRLIKQPAHTPRVWLRAGRWFRSPLEAWSVLLRVLRRAQIVGSFRPRRSCKGCLQNGRADGECF